MTLDALLDAVKTVYMRSATGPLKDRAWRLIRTHMAPELQSYLRHNPSMGRIDYTCHALVDSDGHSQFNDHSVEEARMAWLRGLGSSRPENALEVSIRIRRSPGGS